MPMVSTGSRNNQSGGPFRNPNSLVLTPHIGEMSRLTGKSVEEILDDPAPGGQEAARTWRQIVVLKHGSTFATDGKNTSEAPEVALRWRRPAQGMSLPARSGHFLHRAFRRSMLQAWRFTSEHGPPNGSRAALASWA